PRGGANQGRSSVLRDVDVIKFGSIYCPQNERAATILEMLMPTTRQERCSRRGRNAHITRLLRERGLVVLTHTSVRSGPLFGRLSAPRGKRARRQAKTETRPIRPDFLSCATGRTRLPLSHPGGQPVLPNRT